MFPPPLLGGGLYLIVSLEGRDRNGLTLFSLSMRGIGTLSPTINPSSSPCPSIRARYITWRRKIDTYMGHRHSPSSDSMWRKKNHTTAKS
ncbi:hypothetical protein M434DRAFT_274329 [Hypoxylon sp. CO27-5]|nr:hypothetical protein M434DRAFT_274329 [Hypoxylon sp. CO27-5]